MLTIVAVTALALGLPGEWAGVWSDQEGQTIVISPRGALQWQMGDRSIWSVGLELVPDGFYRGKWQGSVALQADEVLDNPKWVKPSPVDPRSAPDTGEIGIWRGPLNGYGQLANIQVEIRDANGAIKNKGPFVPSLAFGGISFAGTWADKDMTVTVTDRKGSISGTVVTNQGRGIFTGQRVGTSGGAYITDGSTGKQVGTILLVWAPTPALVKASKGRVYVSDRIRVGIQMPGFPTGTYRYLPREVK